ncbi:hypothetical protein WCX72_09970 [Sulfurimonas sp. HSL1-6]|uniref:hypothetical protein n=1 Tax=Thiomicrolovo immobilis TaxID=3131935 RepID=UPI0031F74823
MPTTTSPDFEGLTVSVDAAPGGTPAGSPSEIGHLQDINPIIDKSRNSKKYTPINNSAYDEIVSVGSLMNGDFTAQVLYDPEASEGVNKLESGIDNNEEVQIIIELNNSLGTNGTKFTKLVKVTAFKVDGEVDGKLLASITAAQIGSTTKTAAAV